MDLSWYLARNFGIDQFALEGGDLSEVSVARKMSWAADRQTSRPEDMAYCLMGLFDVNMPLLYGEGEKAFYRLQEEIIKSTVDDSIFAWNRTEWHLNEEKRPYSGLLALSPHEFKGIGQAMGLLNQRRSCAP